MIKHIKMHINKHVKKHSKKVWSILFTLYIIYLVYLTQFSETYSSRRAINMTPFIGILSYFKMGGQEMIVNIIGNMVAFMPMGFLLPFMSDRLKSIIKIIFLSSFVSITIEILQYTFKTRVSDIDDVILNVFGGVIGYAFYLLYVFIINHTSRWINNRR